MCQHLQKIKYTKLKIINLFEALFTLITKFFFYHFPFIGSIIRSNEIYTKCQKKNTLYLYNKSIFSCI